MARLCLELGLASIAAPACLQRLLPRPRRRCKPAAACDLLCATRPPIPAVNRWGKHVPSYGWWLLGILAHRLLPRCFRTVAAHGGSSDGACLPEDVARNLLGATEGDDVDVNEAREELKRRRAAGARTLESFEDNLCLAVNVAVLAPLQQIHMGSYGARGESQCLPGEGEAQRPELHENIARGHRCQSQYSALLAADPAEDRHGDGVWTIFPWAENFQLQEEWRLKMRRAIMVGMGGVFLRARVPLVESDGGVAYPHRLLNLPHLSTEGQAQQAERFCGEAPTR